MSIPVSTDVNVFPGTVDSGGSNYAIRGIYITKSARAPVGGQLRFPNANAVGIYFGFNSPEYAVAQTHFLSFDGSSVKPAVIAFVSYPVAAVAAWVRGAPLGYTLAQLKALPAGTLTVATDGNAAVVSGNINLSAVASFAAAAAAIAAAFQAPGFAVTYDAQSGAFQFTSNTTGLASAVTVAAGPLANALQLTPATGATVSVGAVASDPFTFMTRLVATVRGFVTWTYLFDPDNGVGNTNKLAFAAWNAAQGGKYILFAWDQDAAAVSSGNGAAATFGYITQDIGNSGANSQAGVSPIYAPINGAVAAAFEIGSAASIDFDEENGYVNLKFRKQAGMSPDVTDATSAVNLKTNGYNFMGGYSSDDDDFIYWAEGTVGGKFPFVDQLICENWAVNAFQVGFVKMFQANKGLSGDTRGYTTVRAVAQTTIDRMVRFGMISQGVAISPTQRASLMAATGGLDISGVMSTYGYYFFIVPQTPEQRAIRAPLRCGFFYVNGGQINGMNVPVNFVQ